MFESIPANLAPENVSMKSALNMLTKIASSTSNASANKDRKNLSAFWEFGKKYHDFPKTNPFRQVDRFPEKPGHHYVPPSEDFWKVYEAVDNDDKTMLLTFLHTAARRSEILQLKWDDVDLKQSRIRLSTCKTRDGSRKQVWLTMSSALHEALAEHKLKGGKNEYVFSSKRTNENYVDRKHFLVRICKKIGIKPFGYYGIRGLSATVLAQAGIPLPEIQRILRHANMTTTELYIQALGVSPDLLGAAFDKMAAAPKILPFRAPKQI
jgi:integrase